MASPERVSCAALTDFAGRVLASIGACDEQAQVFARALIWSDLIGRPTHGVWRLPAYVKRLRLGLIKCPCQPRFQLKGLAVDLLDGDEGLGHYVGHLAMQHAVAKAREFGIGAVGVHNSNHFGTGAYYVQLAAAQGMIGLALSNSLAKVAAHGGVKAVFGTNPFAFAAPGARGRGVMLDMATAAVCGSQVMKCEEAGLPLPEGLAIDAEGRSILDPARINEGALLPFGGAKGSGLALMIEILGSVLTGAMLSRDVNSMFNNFKASGKNGHFFVAIDIARFMDPGMFGRRLDSLLDNIRASGPKGARVAIPGEARWEHYEDSMANGVPLDAATFAALENLAAECRVPGLFDEPRQKSALRGPARQGI